MKALLKLMAVVCFLGTSHFVNGQEASFKRFAVQSSHTEFGQKHYELKIDVPENQYFDYVSYVKKNVNDSTGGNGEVTPFTAEIDFYDKNKNLLTNIIFAEGSSSFGRTDIIGPAQITIKQRLGRIEKNTDGDLVTPTLIVNFGIVTFKNPVTSAKAPLPSNTVVIPTDASGPVEIIMESSKDLVNWTRAEPGTYGADTPKRFFRVRAVVKP